MKVIGIHLTNDENSRMKAVAEILLENGSVLEDVRVIESDGVMTVNVMNQYDPTGILLSDDEIKLIEEMTKKAYKELIKED